MKILTKLLLSTLFVAILNSCSSDNDAPMPIEKITYDQHIKPIIDGNCLACHIDPPVNGAPFSLITYDDVKSEASDILIAISKQTGEVNAMPRSGRLPQVSIDLVDQWIKDGLLEK